MSKNGFRELRVWQKGKELAVTIYRITSESPFNRDFGLRDQMRRAAVSIPSNIAEGDERNTDKEAVRFFYVSKVSRRIINTVDHRRRNRLSYSRYLRPTGVGVPRGIEDAVEINRCKNGKSFKITCGFRR